MKKITIAIDGHSSCGKSTMAKDLAREVGYVYVDTGAMYRSVTLYALRHDLFREDGSVKTDALEQQMADAVAGPAYRGGNAAGHRDVVVLDEHGIVEPETVI